MADEIRVGPPPGWDPAESTERIRARAHALPEHKVWLAQRDAKGNKVNSCWYCEPGSEVADAG